MRLLCVSLIYPPQKTFFLIIQKNILWNTVSNSKYQVYLLCTPMLPVTDLRTSKQKSRAWGWRCLWALMGRHVRLLAKHRTKWLRNERGRSLPPSTMWLSVQIKCDGLMSQNYGISKHYKMIMCFHLHTSEIITGGGGGVDIEILGSW